MSERQRLAVAAHGLHRHAGIEAEEQLAHRLRSGRGQFVVQLQMQRLAWLDANAPGQFVDANPRRILSRLMRCHPDIPLLNVTGCRPRQSANASRAEQQKHRRGAEARCRGLLILARMQRRGQQHQANGEQQRADTLTENHRVDEKRQDVRGRVAQRRHAGEGGYQVHRHSEDHPKEQANQRQRDNHNR